MIGIAKTLETIGDLEVLAVSGIAIVKDLKGDSSMGGVFKVAMKMMPVLQSVKELIQDAPASLPELKELDAGECAQLGAAGYKLVKSVIEAVKK